MKNALATFQHMVNRVITGLQGCEGYIDEVIVYAETWEEYLHQMRQLFITLREAQLTVNLAKSELGCARIAYLRRVVGQGHVKPVDIKVEAVTKFLVPTSRQELMRFLRMASYYRKFCKNFSLVAEPLTCLLCKNQKFKWSMNCSEAFKRVKSLLITTGPFPYENQMKKSCSPCEKSNFIG